MLFGYIHTWVNMLICVCSQRDKQKGFNPAVTIWVLVFCESAPLHRRHKPIPAVLSQRQHRGWICCLLLSSVGRHEHLPKPRHLRSTYSHLLPTHFLAWLLQNSFTLSLHFPSPRADLQDQSDSLACAVSQLLPINDGHLALAGPCPLGLTGRQVANHSQGKHGIQKKNSFSPTEELLCAQGVSPVGEDPGGFLHAQRPPP